MTGMPMPAMTAVPTLARPRVLSTGTCTPAIGWPVTSAAPASSYRHESRGLDLRSVNHNSIVGTDALPATAGRGGFSADTVAKQAAPPRGVPR